MDYPFSFEKLDVWKLAKELSVEMYKITKNFPHEERYGLAFQMNRAAEGSARKRPRDKANFYQIAYSSLMEVASQLLIAKDLGFPQEDMYKKLRKRIYAVSNKLNALYKSQLNTSTTQH
jgi:four helix bundle protein